ncbi:MAG: ABC transporter substrate-binding protein [Sphingomonas sp.]|uniref:ABC transporter substrate-binding protein n=1 Tax=Sphingomonas sp. TaxID=28214 RepID=UPI001ACCEBBD|nr:ABC transporter substrate-binding protein [Sphingomonas sp.]MBN8808700.1 ABC transporter substrate-binding protein [Sphingomonas sp.]
MIAAIALALAGCTTPPARTGGVVSTNPCADQLLLALAPDRVAAISHYSLEAGEGSVPLAVARRYRGTAGTAEEVIALKPDLVLASSFEPAATLAAYRRVGLRVLTLDSPTTIAASRDQVRQVAAALRRPAAGDALIARIDAAVAAAAPQDAARPTALLFIAGTLANGGPTLLSEMMARAGLGDGAAAQGLTMTAAVPIERIVLRPPAVLLEPDPSARVAVLRRQVLAKAGYRVAEARFPRALVNCGGPTIVPALARLAAIRQAVVRWNLMPKPRQCSCESRNPGPRTASPVTLGSCFRRSTAQ